MISAFYVLLKESFLLPRSLICSPVLSWKSLYFCLDIKVFNIPGVMLVYGIKEVGRV